MKKYVAEFIGTAILVVFGCGSAVAANTMFSAMGMLPVAFTTLLIAVAFGLSLTAIIYIFGDVSGAHVNPAVSLGMFITKRMNGKDFVGYVIAQILGATGGALLLSFLVNSKTTLGANGYDDASTFGIGIAVALVLEIVLTFVFVSVVLKVTDSPEKKSVAGLAIGAALALVHLLGVPFTGTSVNPARSLGPALVQALENTEALTQVWVFIIGPLVGAILAAGLYIFLSNGDDEEDDEEEEEVEGVDIPLEALTDEEREEIKAIAAEEGVQVDVECCDCDAACECSGACDDSASEECVCEEVACECACEGDKAREE